MKGKPAHNRIELSGQRFGKLVVGDYLFTHKKKPFWRCLCDCGHEKVTDTNRLRMGVSTHCGCVKQRHKPIIQLAGQRFGRLLVLEQAGMRWGNALWECLCDCGNKKQIVSKSLRSGDTVSCGCFRLDRVREACATHGESRVGKRTLRYTMWVAAKKRARDQNVPFNLTLDDVAIPKTCPILGVPLRSNARGKVITDNSPSLDKIIPSLGYVAGNVWVISLRANRIKDNASLEEIEMLAKVLKEKLEERR